MSDFAAVNGYSGYNYGPPPVPNYNPGYYNNSYPLLVQSAPPAHAPYQLHGYPNNNYYAPQPQPQPQPPSNYGYYSAPQPQPQPPSYGYHPAPQPQPQPPSPVARRPKAKNGRTGGKPSSSEVYTISRNRISGNKGDHHGIFNVGNKHGRRDIDEEEEEQEEN
ncbi:PREDICTED: circumsporozoite-like isoform X2 [Prunus dulcis]|uniref:PREDICTED: circumsporozoite-like isoform X2 n=1 Tax=Prunus dulcis TaxID=3755 RepID=A0A5E4F9R9_PRUDU|nr:hypothetical protein L3X38_002189 [Prunus dulcis]VVA24616.1 PREDICTED: circumsporozoite-like isoform X2 [Prunus dulcis]